MICPERWGGLIENIERKTMDLFNGLVITLLGNISLGLWPIEPSCYPQRARRANLYLVRDGAEWFIAIEDLASGYLMEPKCWCCFDKETRVKLIQQVGRSNEPAHCDPSITFDLSKMRKTPRIESFFNSYNEMTGAGPRFKIAEERWEATSSYVSLIKWAEEFPEAEKYWEEELASRERMYRYQERNFRDAEKKYKEAEQEFLGTKRHLDGIRERLTVVQQELPSAKVRSDKGYSEFCDLPRTLPALQDQIQS